MRNVKRTVLGRAVTGTSFFVERFDELKSLRVPVQSSRQTDVVPVRSLRYPLSELTGHQVFADIA